MFLAEISQHRVVGWLSKQVNSDYRSRVKIMTVIHHEPLAVQVFRVDIVVLGTHVDKYRSGSHHRYGLGSGEECEVRHKDCITGSYA